MQFAAEHHNFFRRVNRHRLIGVGILLWAFLTLAAPTVLHSSAHHLFADMPNLSAQHAECAHLLPFSLASRASCFVCPVPASALKGEMWGWVWVLFYAGIAAAAFGSAYYHLKPDDDPVIWDKLPVMIAVVSLLSNLVIETVDERTGITCLFSLLTLVLVSIVCKAGCRTFNDLRLCMMFNFVPCVVIPALVILFPPKHTHSRFWFLAIGFYLLSRIGALADKKVYCVNQYFLSGQS